jgi:hypothetical protein
MRNAQFPSLLSDLSLRPLLEQRQVNDNSRTAFFTRFYRNAVSASKVSGNSFFDIPNPVTAAFSM